MALLQYDFRAVGVENVMRAMRSVEARAMQSMRRIGNEAGRTRIAGVPATTASKALGTSGRPRMSETARGFDQIGRAARAAELKRAREEIAIANRTARQRVRIAEKAAAAEARAYAQAQRRAASHQQRFRAATVGTIGRSAGGAVRAIGAGAGGVLALGGGFAIANAVQSEKTFKGQTAALANQAFTAGGPSRQAIQNQVEAQARTIGISSGLGKEGVVGGLREFTAISGNLKAGQTLAPMLAQLANATDADISDVGRTGGQIFQSIGARYDTSTTEGLNKALGETEQILLAMAGQAKVGSIEFKDLATQMGKTMSATSGFTGDISDLATSMGAISQLAIAGGASSPEEAMTAIMRFRDDLVQNEKRFKKQGIDVFTDKSKTKLRGPEEILFDVLGKTGGDLTKIKGMFGTRAAKAVEPFQGRFVEAGGGEAGLKAVRTLLDSVKGAKMSRGELQESSTFRAGQADRQWTAAADEFKSAVGQELLPAVTRLIPKFIEMLPAITKAVEAMGKLITWFSENPLRGVGAIILAAVAKDVAAAGLGAVLKRLLEAGVRPPTPTNNNTTPTNTPLANVSTAATIAAAGHAVVAGADSALGLERHKIRKALPGMGDDGFSLEQFGKDMNPAEFIPKAGGAIGRAGQELGLWKGQGFQMEKGVGKEGAQQTASAKPFTDAGDKLDAGAQKFLQAVEQFSASTNKLNRGNTPSPIK